MAKSLTEYVCQSCGHRAPKWLGKCPECEEWDTLVEEKIKGTGSGRKIGRGSIDKKSVQPVTEVEAIAQDRLITGIGEFDRTLGRWSGWWLSGPHWRRAWYWKVNPSITSHGRNG